MIHRADKELKTMWLATFNELDQSAKASLKLCLEALRKDALSKANHCWRKHKAPMALYWKVVGVYAGHLAKSIRV